MKATVGALGLFCAVSAAAVLPEWNSYPGHSPAVETRSLDEIYEAAKKEEGSLIVLWGGDGTFYSRVVDLPSV